MLSPGRCASWQDCTCREGSSAAAWAAMQSLRICCVLPTWQRLQRRYTRWDAISWDTGCMIILNPCFLFALYAMLTLRQPDGMQAHFQDVLCNRRKVSGNGKNLTVKSTTALHRSRLGAGGPGQSASHTRAIEAAAAACTPAGRAWRPQSARPDHRGTGEGEIAERDCLCGPQLCRAVPDLQTDAFRVHVSAIALAYQPRSMGEASARTCFSASS